MRGENYFHFIGVISSEPECRENVTRIQIEVVREYRSKGRRVKEDDQFPIFFYDKLAEITSSMLKKGDVVFIKGRIEHNYIVDDDGRKHSSFKFRANEFNLLVRNPSIEDIMNGDY